MLYLGFEKVRGDLCLFVAASHQTRLDSWSNARRPIKVGIKGRGRSRKSAGTTVYLSLSPGQTRLDSWSNARRPIEVGIKERGRSGTSRDTNPAGLCCSSAHFVQCEPDEASS